MKPLLSCLLLLCSLACSPASAALAVSLIPQQPLIERGRNDQRLNFDLLFVNADDMALELQSLEVTLFDPQGRFISQRRLDGNGDSATKSILTIPNRVLPAKGRLVVFNPFSQFEHVLWLGDLRYEAVFGGGEGQLEQRVNIRVSPKAFAARTLLQLPVGGEVFLHDGHDLTAHHRRLDITGAMTTHFGITGNFMRYAHDFTIADAQGKLYRNEGERPEDWFGYGAPILATADGVVTSMHDGMPDNRKGAAAVRPGGDHEKSQVVPRQPCRHRPRQWRIQRVRAPAERQCQSDSRPALETGRAHRWNGNVGRCIPRPPALPPAIRAGPRGRPARVLRERSRAQRTRLEPGRDDPGGQR